MAHGEPIAAAMRGERINRKELAALLRRRGVSEERWNEVRAGYLENEGPLST